MCELTTLFGCARDSSHTQGNLYIVINQVRTIIFYQLRFYKSYLYHPQT